MTSRYSRKGILTGISVAALVATAIGMADIIVKDDMVDKSAEAIVEQRFSETKDLVLKDLSHSDLVKQLANEKFLVREDASKLIWRRGKPTLSALEEAVVSTNPELISRAAELIRYIIQRNNTRVIQYELQLLQKKTPRLESRGVKLLDFNLFRNYRMHEHQTDAVLALLAQDLVVQ